MPIATEVRGIEAIENRDGVLGVSFRWSPLRLSLPVDVLDPWRGATCHLERRGDGVVEAVGTAYRESGVRLAQRFPVA